MGPVKRITELRLGECRFPTGSDGSGHLFCSAEQQEGSSYCCDHHRICYDRRPIRGIQIAAILARASEGYGLPSPSTISQRLDVPVDVWMAACSDIEDMEDADD